MYVGQSSKTVDQSSLLRDLESDLEVIDLRVRFAFQNAEF